jgi:hypothetical protein
VRYIADFFDDLERAKSYLQVMSDHFGERGL